MAEVVRLHLAEEGTLVAVGPHQFTMAVVEVTAEAMEVVVIMEVEVDMIVATMMDITEEDIPVEDVIDECC